MAKREITTIKVEKTTKERVDKLRIHNRETYDEILQRVLGILTLARNEPERAQARLRGIEKQHRVAEVKAGKVRTTVKKSAKK